MSKKKFLYGFVLSVFVVVQASEVARPGSVYSVHFKNAPVAISHNTPKDELFKMRVADSSSYIITGNGGYRKLTHAQAVYALWLGLNMSHYLKMHPVTEGSIVQTQGWIEWMQSFVSNPGHNLMQRSIQVMYDYDVRIKPQKDDILYTTIPYNLVTMVGEFFPDENETVWRLSQEAQWRAIRQLMQRSSTPPPVQDIPACMKLAVYKEFKKNIR